MGVIPWLPCLLTTLMVAEVMNFIAGLKTHIFSAIFSNPAALLQLDLCECGNGGVQICVWKGSSIHADHFDVALSV
jgi:hypothetical protein